MRNGRTIWQKRPNFRGVYLMTFDSVVFLFAFLPVLLIVYHIAPARVKNGALLLASLIFYGWGGLGYLCFMAVSVVFNYICGLWIAGQAKKRRSARLRLIICVALNVLMLLILKYGRSLLEGMYRGQNTGEDAGVSLEWLAPVGITFYTLQILSYIIDVYRGNVKVQKNPVDFALYAALFVKLPAGPVVKYHAFERQLHDRKSSWVKLGEGAMFFIRGLAKKVILADNLGRMFADIMAAEAGRTSALCAWLGCAALVFQVYFAFSGYSDMAVGLGWMFGFSFPKNFDYPYGACSVSEFWRRWHISLTAWVEEYVYRLLGRGSAFGVLFIWLLAGLWHGISWNHAIWGIYFGVLTVAGMSIPRGSLKGIPRFLRRIFSMILIFIGWVFFLTPTPGEAVSCLQVMFGGGESGLTDHYGRYILVTNLGLLIVAVLALTPRVYRGIEKIFNRGGRGRALVNGVIYGALFLVCAAYLVAGVHYPFLYLRF